MSPKLQRQQGDVLLQQVSGLPKGARRITREPEGLLFRGEATGHLHVLEGEGVELYQVAGVLYAVVPAGGASLTHQTHHPQHVEPGIWRAGQVREQDHLAGLSRPVID